MRRDQQRPARRFITTARLHAHEAVLNQIHPSNRVARTNFVQQLNQRHRIKLHAIYRNRNPFLETNGHLLVLVRRFLWRASHLPRCRQRRIRGIFQFSAFVTEVPEIAVPAVNFLAARRHRDAVLFGVIEAIFTRFQRPLPPRRDHFQLWRERLIR